MTRRTLLEWFGRASAVSLASVVAACASGDDSTPSAADPGRSTADAGPSPTDEAHAASTPEPMPDNSGKDMEEMPKGILFGATTDEDTTVNPWGENTVDVQDEQSILASWSLTIDGLVETPLTLSFAEMIELERQDQVTDFHCVEGWSVLDVPWNGVHHSTLFALAKPLSNATHVTYHGITAPDGRKYDESLPIEIALEAKTLLAYGADGLALPMRHGFPLRVVIPRLMGYKGAKSIERIELTDGPIDGFWVQRGYPYDAPVQEQRLREGKF